MDVKTNYNATRKSNVENIHKFQTGLIYQLFTTEKLEMCLLPLTNSFETLKGKRPAISAPNITYCFVYHK